MSGECVGSETGPWGTEKDGRRCQVSSCGHGSSFTQPAVGSAANVPGRVVQLVGASSWTPDGGKFDSRFGCTGGNLSMFSFTWILSPPQINKNIPLGEG